MRFNEQKNIIINLNVHSGQSTRMDCPFCFHANTLQVTKDNGQIKWYCFSASCDAKGITDIEKTMEDINYMVKKKVEQKIDWKVPDHFQPGHSTHAVAKYLSRTYNMTHKIIELCS